MDKVKENSVVFVECTNNGEKIVVDYQDARRIANIRFLDHEGHIKSVNGSFHIAGIIMEVRPGFDAHHDNENKYDNRRKNLMEKTHRGHAHLSRKKGCGVVKRSGKWWRQWRQWAHGKGVTVSFTFEHRGEAIRFVDWIGYVMYGKEAVLYSPGHICSALAVYMMMHNGGDCFEVLFDRRSGKGLRRMTCKYVGMDEESLRKLLKLQLIPVTIKGPQCELDTTFRVIPIEGIKELRINGKHFIVSEE